MSNYNNIEKVQSKIEKIDEKFNLFIEKNKINNNHKEYILNYLEYYKKEIYFMKTFLFLVNKDEQTQFNEKEFKILLLEINEFINNLNKIINQ